jgi:predicted acylesterase/phospholipase RssA
MNCLSQCRQREKCEQVGRSKYEFATSGCWPPAAALSSHTSRRRGKKHRLTPARADGSSLVAAANLQLPHGVTKGNARVVGADLAHSRMVVFPEDVGLYVDEQGDPLQPNDFPIADAVRISAGYPYFFPPLSLTDAHTKKAGVLVDGGVTSAFPVFLFDKPKPAHPTWGFRLFGGNPPEKHTAIDGPLWPIDMLKAIVDTSMNALDKLEMIAFAPRAISIPTGPTLDFSLTDAQKKSSTTSVTTPPRPSSRRSRPESIRSARCARAWRRRATKREPATLKGGSQRVRLR